MRYSDGAYKPAPGYRFHRAAEVYEIQEMDTGVRLFVPCVPVRGLGDTSYGPAITVELTAPRRDVIEVRAYHYNGKDEKGPFFTLHTEDFVPEITREEDTLTVQSGRLKAVVTTRGAYTLSFYYDGRFLTRSGENSLSLITDVDYEADKWCDLNHRPALPCHHTQNSMQQALFVSIGEELYGLGERFTPLVRNGQQLDIWNRDSGTGYDHSYKSVPFYLSSRGYGVLVNTPGYVSFEVASESVRNVVFHVESETLSYLVTGGEDPKDALSHYTALTGRSPVPPAWSFGLWLSTSWQTDYSVDVVREMFRKMKEYEIPLSVFHYDAGWMKPYHLCDFQWDRAITGDPEAMLRELKQDGTRICVWINPYVSQLSRLYDEGKKNGYLVKTKDGAVWQNDFWVTGMALVDFTNPAAADCYARRLGEVLEMGVDVIKTDFAERIPTEVVWYDGSDPGKMHNYYTYLYNRTIFNLIRERKGERNAMVFARSATAGSQIFPVHWGGDNTATYESMAESLRGGLSFCQSGFGFWAHDIGGFSSTATPDLYKRWAAFGLLSTHSRLHGETTYRVPWAFDEEACRVLSFFTRLKASLMPYLFAGAVDVNRRGWPLMRAMMLEFPEDLNCRHLDRQYMLGDSLLVAPVFSETGEVTFYVPEDGGLWTDLLSGKTYRGGAWYTQTYDYFSLPLLVRPDTLLPRGCGDNGPEYDYADGVTLHLYEIRDGSMRVAEIFDNDLKVTRTATVSRSGEKLYVQVTGRGRWQLMWHGHGCRSGQAEKSEQAIGGTLLRFADGVTKAEILGNTMEEERSERV